MNVDAQEIANKHKAYLARPGYRKLPAPDFSFRIVKGDLSGLNLERVNLKGAKLAGVNLTGAKLFKSDLSCADLTRAKLAEANLRLADLTRATMIQTDLSTARLFRAVFRDAKLIDTVLRDADMRQVDLTGAIFQPIELPEGVRLSGLKGLETVKLAETKGQFDNPAALQYLRARLRTAGLRDLERDATYALETAYDRRLSGGGIGDGILRVVRVLFLDLTTAYGRSPFRALNITIAIGILCTLLYLLAIWRKVDLPKMGSIKVVKTLRAGTNPDAWPRTNSVSVLKRGFWAALGMSFYFSLLSALAFGLRDMNVGQWFERIQSSPFSLVSEGFVRTLSGLQAVTSLYLLSVWLITQFGRPFG